MTNFEFYKDKLLQFAAEEATNIGLRNGEPINCDRIKCNECDFYGSTCCSNLVKWLCQEYVPIDWSKVEVDTPILVSMDGNQWIKRHFARYVKGRVYFFQNGETSWTQTQNLELVSWKYAKLSEHKNCPNKITNSSNIYQEALEFLEKYSMEYISV